MYLNSTLFFDIRGYFEISVFEISRVECICLLTILILFHSAPDKKG